MRLWSLHPQYLDRQGLLAAWREGLLAQKVLQGKTRGYRNHPQLQRFKEQKDPLAAIAGFLRGIRQEAGIRGYNFDGEKIVSKKRTARIKVSSGQIEFEFNHLLKKLKQRDPSRYLSFRFEKNVAVHPLFKMIKGPGEGWERIK